MFPGFTQSRVDVGPADLAYERAGDGPLLVLLHGYPQTRHAWHEVAPDLTDRYTVVVPDLRGYGDSTGPDDPDTAEYSNRAMAGDIVALAEALGHERFLLAGHDRGARVGYRLALDYPDRVRKLALLDVVPTLETAEMMDHEYAKGMFHWLFLAQPHPVPERLVAGAPEFFVDYLIEKWAGDPGALAPEAVAEYHAAFGEERVVRASCEDYRAGLSVDLDHDRASRAAGERIACPLLALWGGGSGTVSFDPLAVWGRWAEDVEGRGLDCGHFLMEEAPAATRSELRAFLD